MDDSCITRADQLRIMLLDWGEKNIDNYPWRYVYDPYRVLVSEFMLHRTQTRQVIPIYIKFISHYPDLESFATANPSGIQDNLKSLGLQWRIDGMVRALKHIWQIYHEVPLDFNKLLAIDGIGQYIAGATICFSRNIPITLIDSNIVRVIGRVHGLDLSGEARRRKTVIKAISLSVDKAEPRNFYYAMIDLAHKLCRPSNPACIACPLLNASCLFGNNLLAYQSYS